MGKRGRPPHPDILTPREWQVLDLIRQNLTNEQIALRLDISLATAKYHVSEIVSKLAVETREQAAAWRPDAVAVRWWQRLAALTFARGAGVVRIAVTIVGLGAIAWGVWRTSGDGQPDDVVPSFTTELSQSTELPPTLTASAFIATTRPLGQILFPLPAGTTSISEEGAYLVDVETGQIWKSDRLGTFSPDETRILRTLCCTQGEQGLDVIDFAMGNAVRIIDRQVYSFAWSPDGSHIAFSEFTGATSEGIFIIRPDGSELRKLRDLTNTGLLSWSPDGSYLLSRTLEVARVVSVETGEEQVLPDVTDAAWLPEGSALVYGSSNGLFLLNPETAQIHQLSSLPTSSNILPSPDGTRLLASASGAVQVFRVDGSEEPFPLPAGRYFSWSPDGTRIAFIGEGCITDDWNVFLLSTDSRITTALTVSPGSTKEGLSWLADNVSVVYSTGSEFVLLNSETRDARVLASVVSDSAGYLHYHGGIRSWGPNEPDNRRYVGFGASVGGHGICD